MDLKKEEVGIELKILITSNDGPHALNHIEIRNYYNKQLPEVVTSLVSAKESELSNLRCRKLFST